MDSEMEVIDEQVNDENMEDDESSSSDDDDDDDEKEPEVYLPGKPLAEGEELVCDDSAYIMLHQAHTGAPCLSFDIIRDDLGDARKDFPMTAYIVSGTQAARTHVNSVIVMKMSNLHRTSKERDEDEESDSSDDDEDEEPEEEAKKPKMECALIKHQGCVNRIRSTRMENNVLAA